MKCPKCGYLGFEAVERCRNCGYDFSLAPSLALPELPMRDAAADEANAGADLSLIDAASPAERPILSASQYAPDLERMLSPTRGRDAEGELPLFNGDDDAPLISGTRPPRPPLAVRRATPEVPRLRNTAPRTPMLEFTPSEPHAALSPSVTPAARGRGEEWIAPLPDDGPEAATLGSRLLAVVVDLMILLAIDTVVVYLTMQICGLDVADIAILPRGPLIGFLLVQNGGYLVAFTAGGQTLGKMVAGIKVVPSRSSATLDLGQAAIRTLIWTLLAAPAGLGLLSAFASSDRRGLHDRVAGTKVVRATA
ncbi:MAG TPA: RDD family protein [Vicinamibacterales bacterium]|jgi:uncharacterized RDD family membrane protein YckC|nr:RDD family protein [Vicinamibacterales bacterium]